MLQLVSAYSTVLFSKFAVIFFISCIKSVTCIYVCMYTVQYVCMYLCFLFFFLYVFMSLFYMLLLSIFQQCITFFLIFCSSVFLISWH
jgi:hypothetical protein